MRRKRLGGGGVKKIYSNYFFVKAFLTAKDFRKQKKKLEGLAVKTREINEQTDEFVNNMARVREQAADDVDRCVIS